MKPGWSCPKCGKFLGTLAIDEISMISMNFFALLASIAIGIGDVDNLSFGGIGVILLGDFHQFLLVARPLCDSLYYPVDPSSDSLTSQIGWTIYEEFSTVVELKEQRQVTNLVWCDFLQHLQQGAVNTEHLKMLWSLIISSVSHGCDKPQGDTGRGMVGWGQGMKK